MKFIPLNIKKYLILSRKKTTEELYYKRKTESNRKEIPFTQEWDSVTKLKRI